jgi:nicotinate-nucleotide adenylyltransferase
MGRVGLLTGTFDPVHLGHLELAASAKQALGLDRVWFLVNAHTEQSESYKKAAGFADRLAMVRAAVADSPDITVYEGALALRPHNIRTFIDLFNEHPNDGFVFITGMDTIGRLDRWEDFESVVKNTSFAVSHRPGTPITALSDLQDRLNEAGLELKAEVFETRDFGEASSTKIRRELEGGRVPAHLDPRVFEYIKQNKLYR